MPTKDPWPVVSYEIDMLEQLEGPTRLAGAFRNALTESRVLHARQLCEIFLGRPPVRTDDIRLDHLVHDWNNSGRLRELVDRLSEKYGHGSVPDSPCWIFNKKMAHATFERSDNYNYETALAAVCPALKEIVAEIEFVTGKKFSRGLADDGYTFYLSGKPALTTDSSGTGAGWSINISWLINISTNMKR